MSEWAGLPLLPLRCVLEHLSTEDALAAMSTCCHWRSAILLYEGHKETLKLRAKQLEKCIFLARIFKRHTQKLHIYVDCNERELDKFINFVLPLFFDTVKLLEVLFVGPSYLRQNQSVPIVKLKRILLESLIFKHQHNIKKVALFGCEMGIAKNEKESFPNKNVEYYSRLLSFNNVSSPADTILSRCNADMMAYSTLQHLLVDYDQVSTQTLETLSVLPVFRHLSINIPDKRSALRTIDWRHLHRCYTNTLHVAVNIISLPYRKFKSVLDNVLVEGMMLTSLKVMFCKTLYARVLAHVARLYPATLRELVWADAPLRHFKMDELHEDLQNANPFILLCWQCVNLRRLVIHGYWVWQYDLLGFIRLRKSLRQLEVSALYHKQARFGAQSEGGARVLVSHVPVPTDNHFTKIVNNCIDFEWKPTPWETLHPALRSSATAQQRAHYIVQETMDPLGVT